MGVQDELKDSEASTVQDELKISEIAQGIRGKDMTIRRGEPSIGEEVQNQLERNKTG